MILLSGCDNKMVLPPFAKIGMSVFGKTTSMDDAAADVTHVGGTTNTFSAVFEKLKRSARVGLGLSESWNKIYLKKYWEC